MSRSSPLTAHPWLVWGAFGSARLLFPLARSSKPTSGIAPLTTTFTCTGMVTPCPWWLECVNTLLTTSRRNPRPGAFGDPVSMPPTPTLRLRPNPLPPRQPGWNRHRIPGPLCRRVSDGPLRPRFGRVSQLLLVCLDICHCCPNYCWLGRSRTRGFHSCRLCCVRCFCCGDWHCSCSFLS